MRRDARRETDDHPYAEVEQVFRWTYRVYVVDGRRCYGPEGYGWHVIGRNRADRKARRVVAKYVREESYRRGPWRVDAS